jgi:hypothetical protein
MLISKRFLSLVAGAVIAIGLSSAAHADTWLPKYNSSEHVRIAPDVDAATRANIESSSMASQVNTLSQQYGLDVYVIVTTTGSEVSGPVGSSGSPLVRRVWDMWTNHGLPSQRALVILMTGKPGSNLSSVGVRAGEWMNGMGINRDTMNADDGPVRPVARDYLGSSYNPAAVPPAIVSNINAIIAARTTPAQAPTAVDTSVGSGSPVISTQPVGQSEGNGPSFLVVVCVVGLATCIIGIFIALRRSKKAAAGNSFEDRMRSSASRPPQAGSGDYGPDVVNRTTVVTPIGTSSVGRDVTMVGAGVLTGVLLEQELERQRQSRLRDSGTSSATDSGYVAPAYIRRRRRRAPPARRPHPAARVRAAVPAAAAALAAAAAPAAAVPEQ